MTWHRWIEDAGDGWEKHTFAYVPDTDHTFSTDWPEDFCGPEYWMHMIAYDLEKQLDDEDYEQEE